VKEVLSLGWEGVSGANVGEAEPRRPILALNFRKAP
jgi:hypothetical protein